MPLISQAKHLDEADDQGTRDRQSYYNELGHEVSALKLTGMRAAADALKPNGERRWKEFLRAVEQFKRKVDGIAAQFSNHRSIQNYAEDADRIVAELQDDRQVTLASSVSTGRTSAAPLNDDEYFKFGSGVKRVATPTQRQALTTWAHTSEYKEINAALRAGASHELGETIVQAIRAAPLLPRDVTVYRGVEDGPDMAFSTLQPGDEFSDSGIVAVTSNRAVLDRINLVDNAKMIVIEITLKAGSRALPISMFSKYWRERELILESGQRFRVTSCVPGLIAAVRL